VLELLSALSDRPQLRGWARVPAASLIPIQQDVLDERRYWNKPKLLSLVFGVVCGEAWRLAPARLKPSRRRDPFAWVATFA
jgi:hypothetical protein